MFDGIKQKIDIIKQKFDSAKQKIAEKAKEITMGFVFEKDSWVNEKPETLLPEMRKETEILLPKVRNEIELLLPQVRKEAEILIDGNFQKMLPKMKKIGIMISAFLLALLVVFVTCMVALVKIAFF